MALLPLLGHKIQQMKVQLWPQMFYDKLWVYAHNKESLFDVFKKRTFLDWTTKRFLFQQIIMMCTTTLSFLRDIVNLNTIATLDFGGLLSPNSLLINHKLFPNSLLINHKLLESMQWPLSIIYESYNLQSISHYFNL